jgi:hypothetical protein
VPKKLALALSLTLVTLALAVPAHAQVIGTPADAGDGNCFPFGCVRPGGDRYQQVYAASNFLLPFTITDISFFNTEFVTGGDQNSGTYNFWLSTTTKAVNGLDADMNANVGTNELFGSFVLTGGAPPVLTFATTTGGFVYDPSLGNLLLDIQITGISHVGTSTATEVYLDARNGTALPTQFSRMHNFGAVPAGFANYGLVTMFEGTTGSGSDVNSVVGVVPEPGTVFLLATGLVGLGMATRRRQKRMST